MVIFTIGTDFESFLYDEKRNDLKSAIGIIHGTKRKPLLLENNAGLHYDNVCLELAAPFAVDEETFKNSINVSLAHTHTLLKNKYKILFKPSAFFPSSELSSTESQKFGCDPDYNAWSIKQNPQPMAKNKNLRTAGAHISIGYLKNSGYDFLLQDYGRIDVIRVMDTLLGIPSLLLDRSKEASERRELYGKAGAHRPRAYGVEYRVLSNFWIKTNRLISLVYNITHDCLELIKNGKAIKLIEYIDGAPYIYTGYEGRVIESTINNNNLVLADEIMIKLFDEKVYSEKTVDLLTEELKW